MKRFIQWLIVITTTKTHEGPWLFFHRVYLLMNLATVIERVHSASGRKFRQYIHKKYNKGFIISNRLGLFAINACNDSLTKSITSFEYKHQNWLSKPGNKNTFIDIGANIGFYSILAIKKYGYKKALAFEPNPNTYSRLVKNIKLNNLEDSIEAFQIGLSDDTNKATLATKSVHTGASTMCEGKQNLPNFEVVDIETDSFDNFRRTKNIKTDVFDFIKIDVEGYEGHVLAGMQQTLRNLKPDSYMFIEIFSEPQHLTSIQNTLEENGLKKIIAGTNKNYLYKKL